MTDCLVNRLDHTEIATKDIKEMQKLFEVLGFVCTQTRETSEVKNRLLVQGQIRMLLSEGAQGSFPHEYAEKHGDGVCSISYHTPDVAKTLKTALDRGAELALAVTTEEARKSEEVTIKYAAIRSFGDVRATFVERARDAFDVTLPFAPGFQMTGAQPQKEVGLLSLDHMTNNVEMGEMEKWSDFYKRIYGWVEARYFDIKASKTGLHSKVLQSPDGGVKIPVNEATEAKSQVQEFCNQHKGAGVQHIALLTNDIRKTVSELAKRGIEFMDTPDSYYDTVPHRLRHNKVDEPIEDLKQKQILVDGDERGYLLQIFTKNQIGPLFFEFIQRKGHPGFGEGNFQALFESIERDQEKRGQL